MFLLRRDVLGTLKCMNTGVLRISLRSEDLGCGGGFRSEALTRKGATVIGVDPF